MTQGARYPVSGVWPLTTMEEHAMDARLNYLTDPTADKTGKYFMSTARRSRTRRCRPPRRSWWRFA